MRTLCVQGRLPFKVASRDAFIDGYCTGLKHSDGQGHMLKADDRPGPWMLGYRIGLAGWVIKPPDGFVEYARDLARKVRK